MNNLHFRRQFLISSKAQAPICNWTTVSIGPYFLYLHPECEHTRCSKDPHDITLIGQVVDPKSPDHSKSEIITRFTKASTVDKIADLLYGLVGRFVLIIKTENNYVIFHDACGLKTVYYTHHEEGFFAASQPLLLQTVVNITPSKNKQTYLDSEYVKYNLEHWLPSGISLFENVYHLVPNHYLDVSSAKQVRYWPNRPLMQLPLKKSTNAYSDILKKSIEAISRTHGLALPLTAGWDSRIILAACKEISQNIYYYTLRYRSLSELSNDIKIAKRLLNKLGLPHDLIQCDKEIEEPFATIYESNVFNAHLNDWGKIAYNILTSPLPSKISIKGNCSEIGRCYYYPWGLHPKISSANDFIKLQKHWEKLDFVTSRIDEWYQEVQKPEVNHGYHLLDLFYWEHRMGSWQAQSQLEGDIAQEVFTPFNNRELLDLMLATKPKYRCEPDYPYLKVVLKTLWKDTLKEPINPTPGVSLKARLKIKIKSTLMQMEIL